MELDPELPAGPVLELCCGVGHIGLLAVGRTGRHGVLVDADPVACGHARANADRSGLGATVRVVTHRLDGGPVPQLRARVPLVLADPPYVPSDDATALREDPQHAVDGGSDGLHLVATVLRSAGAHLADDGICLLQVRGASQALEVAELLRTEWADAGLVAVEVRSLGADRALQLLVRAPIGRYGIVGIAAG